MRKFIVTPRWPEWATEVTFLYDANQLGAKQIEAALALAGERVGVGFLRQERKQGRAGRFGRFRCERSDK